MRRKSNETSESEIRPAFRTVLTGSRPLTSARTLNALFQPTNAKCVLTKAVAIAFPLNVTPDHGSEKFDHGSSMRVSPARTATPPRIRLVNVDTSRHHENNDETHKSCSSIFTIVSALTTLNDHFVETAGTK